MLKLKIEKAKQLKSLVNLCRELVQHNGNYNPERYKHYLPNYKKRIEL
jgi:hypothetical protein